MYLWFLCIFILYKTILLNKEKESEKSAINLFIAHLTLVTVIAHITLATVSLLTTNHTVCNLHYNFKDTKTLDICYFVCLFDLSLLLFCGFGGNVRYK